MNGNPFEVHHVVPLGEGGPDTIDNALRYAQIVTEKLIMENNTEIQKMLIHGLNRETIEQNSRKDQRPQREHGGLGQWIAEKVWTRL